ncbi:MAG: ATP-binding cassette domain-containing protein [Geminicoccaceae bacterium]|nr:ATP-binding cassette domain-containing protein [Geminicoccaceae bacterium]
MIGALARDSAWPGTPARVDRPGLLPLTVADASFEVGGTRLIDRVSFRLEAGRTTIILGPNGAGKSLLLRLCFGLLQPTAGRIVWADDDPGRLRRRLAIVFQRPVLLRRSVEANVDYALKVQGLARAERRERVAEALEEVGLGPLARRSARVLSGGEQQRLQLARAWAQRPGVLFLDEPTAHLDPAATQAVEATVAALRDRGVEIVMTTHDLGQARRLADDVLFMHRGRLLEQAPAERFFHAPACAEAAAFIKGDLLW